MKEYKLEKLPINIDFETKNVLKALTEAHRGLAELKGLVSSIPNESILINTLGLQEAKDSSAIENIITTHDEVYKAELNLEGFDKLNAKEVQNYISALKIGFDLINENNILSINSIIKIQSELEKNNAGIRKVPGTTLKNLKTGELIYTPPQVEEEINGLLVNLEKFINEDSLCDLDPILKMALIHFQFESIHPFYDGNGRTGRIINVLYLVMQNLIDLPILYLSKYIIKTKEHYYSKLQMVREKGEWENWLLYIIEGVKIVSIDTISLIKEMKTLMLAYKHNLRTNYKFYSQDLLNNLFKYPYTKIEYIENDLGVSRITAASYLNKLADDGLLVKMKLGKSNYYINEPLFNLLTR